MTTALSRMSVLLSALSRSAHPDDVARAIVEGPGALLDASAAVVLWHRDHELVVHGFHGYEAAEMDGMAPVALTVDYPVVESFRTGQTLTLTNAAINDDYLMVWRRESHWRPLFERLPDGSLATAPIISNGRPVGAFAVVCVTTPSWDASEFAVLDFISHALGLWLTHPDSGVPVAETIRAQADPDVTPRQIAILTMVRQGRTNTAIAAQLQVSVSTVKQDLTRAMAHLHAADRLAAAESAHVLGLLSPEGPT